MSFDINSFLDSGISAQDKKLIPPGIYSCFVEDIKPASGEVKSGANQGKPWARLDLVLVIDDDRAREATGRSKVVLTHGIMLNLDANGNVEFTKGDRLDKARKALGATAEPFVPRSLVGRYAKVEVTHEMYDGNPVERTAGLLSA